jgi:hypothetical protein
MLVLIVVADTYDVDGTVQVLVAVAVITCAKLAVSVIGPFTVMSAGFAVPVYAPVPEPTQLAKR